LSQLEEIVEEEILISIGAGVATKEKPLVKNVSLSNLKSSIISLQQKEDTVVLSEIPMEMSNDPVASLL
jgi:hypothetical protein